MKSHKQEEFKFRELGAYKVIKGMVKQALGWVSRNDSQNRPWVLFPLPQLQRKN